MASPQPTDSHTRISNELYTQILMRDFTKRQRAILDLIIRLSYGCGKKYAHIPMLKHFSVCGVKKNKISDELSTLKEMSVIDWDNFTNEYWLIKDYDKWELKQPSNDTQELFSELLKLNLRDTQNGNSSSQNGNRSSQKGNSLVPETGTEKLPKGELAEAETPCPTRSSESPITKDNYKEIENIKDKHTEVLNKLAEFFPFGMSSASKYDIEEFMKNIADIELLDIAHNMAVEQKANSKEKYIIGVLRRFLNNGITTLAQYREQETQKQQYIQRPVVYSLDTVPRGMGKRALEAMLEDEELERQQRLLAESAK